MLGWLKRWKYLLVALVCAGIGWNFDSVPAAPRQPIAFTHALHLKAGLHCRDCHRDAAVSASAGLPSVEECVLCHAKIKRQAAPIRQVFAYARQGEEIPWRPVYGFAASAHVRFRHNMHVANGIACATCHGDMRHTTVARQWKPLNMGTCVACHRQHGVNVECQTCHE